MNRFTAFFFALFLVPVLAHAQVPSPTIKQDGRGYDSFLPKNWDVIASDSADFNNDLREDYVFVLQADKDYANSKGLNAKLNALPRVLVILMGVGDSLTFGTKSDSVILRADGGEGDPLNATNLLKTDGNILELNYAGGLSVQWTAQYKFTYNRTSKEWSLTYFRGTEYNTSDEDAPIKVTEVDFNKKYMKQDKAKTPMPNLPKLSLEKFKPRTVTIAPGVVL